MVSLRGFLYPYSKGKDLLNTFYINHFKLYLIMKKILLLSALAGGIATGAQAQQLPNGGFENWDDCVVYRGKTVATKVVGIDPVNWNGSNISQKGAVLGKDKDDPNLVTKVAGNGSAAAVYLHNCFEGVGRIGSVAPAYVTLGTPWAYAQVKGLATIVSSDGGSFGGMTFNSRPDAIKFDYKRAHYENPNGTSANRNDNEAASVVAYLWKGSYTNKQKVGYNGAEEDMTDRDRFVLGSMQSTASDDAKLIAEINAKIEGNAANWTSKTIEFTYKDNNTTPEKLNVIFCAGDYFGDQKQLGVGNSLTIDNVEFIYYHALTSFTYDGITKNIAEDQTEIDFSNTTYDANKTLSYIQKGVGATVVKSYNEADATLTIEVQGNDFAKNPSSKTTYTVQFAKPVSTTGKLSSLTVNGAEVLKTDQFYYTIYGEYNAQSIQWTAEDGDLAKVTSNYDENSRTATVTVSAGQNTNTYFVKFAKKGTSYTSSVMIAMGPIFLGAPVQAVEITPLTPNNTIDLQLMNFSLDGGSTIVGNIFVENVPYQKMPNGDVQLNTTIKDFKIFGDAAQDINPAIKSLTLNGVLSNNDLAATITIDLDGTPILVKVASTSSKYVDATGITGFNFSVVRDALTNPNALIYADAGATNAAANDVVAGTCAELKLTDGHPFNAPVAFKATAVNYNRAFNTTANYVSSFVLPFAMDKAKVDGKVYQFAGVEGDYVNFTEVTEGQLAANTPYLIEATAANPFNQATDVQVAVTPATMQVANGDYAHVGAYTTQAVKSEGNTSYYGYANGAFVKANTGTLNPFRTMIKATVANAQAQFSLKLGNEVTGIIGVNSELGKVDVYNLEGKLIRNQVEATTALQGLAKGVYVINGKKVIK